MTEPGFGKGKRVRVTNEDSSNFGKIGIISEAKEFVSGLFSVHVRFGEGSTLYSYRPRDLEVLP